MIYSNFHTHSSFCDGKHTPEEIVQSAIECGMETLGFSGHAHAAFDPILCKVDASAYRSEILRLKEAYAEKLTILLGEEEDVYEQSERDKYDYIIGSLHYLKVGDKHHSLDWDYAKLLDCAAEFASDPLKLAQAYFETFCDYIETRRPDIIGHFDLITKFDEKHPPLFLGNPDYETMAEHYIARAAKSECLFEVNTGAISRGYRTSPYPSIPLLKTLKRLGARVVLSSDSHSKDTLLYQFDLALNILRDVGFEHVYTLAPSGISEHRI